MHTYLCVYKCICVHVIIMLTVKGTVHGNMGFGADLFLRLRPSTGCIVCYAMLCILLC